MQQIIYRELPVPSTGFPAITTPFPTAEYVGDVCAVMANGPPRTALE
jgi:hypothetical protein